MIEKQFYGEHKKPQLTAYERRKINSQKIAQVQFPKEHPYTPESSHTWSEKEWLKRKRLEIDKEREELKRSLHELKSKKTKETWTPLDQVKEEELWDE